MNQMSNTINTQSNRLCNNFYCENKCFKNHINEKKMNNLYD